MNEYKDIIWIEDFDWKDSEAFNPEINDYKQDDDYDEEIKQYFPPKYHFRIKAYKYAYKALKQLEENFSQYSCAILDINLEQGFGFNGLSEEEEYEDIKNILINENVRIKDEHNFENGYELFTKNAGYYIYLYLIQCGMPSNRISILTGNKGPDNLTGKWENNFHAAGLQAPIAFDKISEKKQLADWLDEKLDKRYRLRSCLLMMSKCMLDMLENPSLKKCLVNDADEQNKKYKGFAFHSKYDFSENLKLTFQGLQNIPLHLPKSEIKACAFFKSIIWQIVSPWEAAVNDFSIDDIQYAYWTTMRTTRNWLAHDVLPKLTSLSIEAFIFGISMRGMFSINKITSEQMKGYIEWENELISIINGKQQFIYSNTSQLIEELDKLRSLAMKSSGELLIRSKELQNGEFTKDICYLIKEIGNKHKGNDISCYETDLLRDFLHGIYEIYLSEEKIANIKVSLGREENKEFNSNREWDYIEAIKEIIISQLNICILK